ncbi:hypothetical protein JCM11251_006599 [Rhodosporidiobolus azoricus]
MDGIIGPLIVHSPEDPLVCGRDFDVDQILFEPAVIEYFKRRLSGLDVAPSAAADESLPDDTVIDDSFHERRRAGGRKEKGALRM